MFIVLKPLRLALKALLAQSSPRQMSLGLALGVLVGLVPKGNLLAVFLGVFLAATRVNLGIAAAAIVAVTFASTLLDPLSDRLGSWLLTMPALQNVWTQLYNAPVMPWTAFNNSVVLGSFVIGLLAVYPVHRCSRPVFEKYSKVVGPWARRFWLTRVLLGAEWADRLGTAG
ncbi:MAG: TIGR03546 family protein [Planctomycetaceae bacterium]